ncbi:hypothetical protein ACIQCG_14815 [Streptomyces noursei]|uniref:hypothetical protein n=1 Tax=Streptomyces noursei TaxID=1971 RepID=UPI00380F9F52
MHSPLRFENPPALLHEVVAETLERALRDRSQEGEAADALVGSALTARRFGHLSDEALALAARAEAI